MCLPGKDALISEKLLNYREHVERENISSHGNISSSETIFNLEGINWVLWSSFGF